MPYKSAYEDLDIPKCNILSFLFPEGETPSDKPVWMDAANPDHSLSPRQMLSWVKRFAVGLDNLGIPKHRAIMVYSSDSQKAEIVMLQDGAGALFRSNETSETWFHSAMEQRSCAVWKARTPFRSTPNHLYVSAVYLASAGSCRMFTGANPTYTANEVAHQISTIEAALLFVHPELLDNGVKAAKQAGLPLSQVYQFSETEQPTSPDGVRDWRSMIGSESASQSWTWDPLRGEASTKTICCVNFSSGTTGLPKGVCISHRNLIANSSQAIYSKYHGTEHSLERPDPNEKWLAMLPLYHAYSQLFTINIACKLKIPVYVMGKFMYEDFLKYIERYKITTLQTVPPVIIMLSKRPETQKYDLSSVKYIMSGAAPLKKEMQNDVSKKLGCVIVQGWGMTETTCAGIMVPGYTKDDSGCTGWLIANTEAKLIDEEGKEVTGDGARGELLIRGPQIMMGYWKREDATKESIDSEGWFRSGDVALLEDRDQGQRWWIVDRMKELIKVRGLQVAPAELEAVLLEHPEVADAAVGGLSVDGDEMPRAYVVLQQGSKVSEADVQKFVAERVAKHKQLTGGVAFIDEVPKLPSGKIVRKLMREWTKRDAKEFEGKARSRL